MLDLSTSALGWIEFADTRIPFADRIKKPYRATGIYLDEGDRRLTMRLSSVKEVGILMSLHLPVYKGQFVVGMFKADIQGGRGKIRSLSEGFAIGSEDLDNSMMAYYEIGSGGDDRTERIGVPVKVVPVIAGEKQIKIVPKEQVILASPDLNGKTIGLRVEFPFPEAGLRLAPDCLTPTILMGDRIVRYHQAKTQPASKEQKTTLVFRDWVREEVTSLRA